MEIFQAIGIIFSAVVALGLLAVLIYAAVTALNIGGNELCKQVLRTRNLAYLHYWTGRLEAEGLLKMDEHYRAASQGRKPTNVHQADTWQQQANKAKENK